MHRAKQGLRQPAVCRNLLPFRQTQRVAPWHPRDDSTTHLQRDLKDRGVFLRKFLAALH